MERAMTGQPGTAAPLRVTMNYLAHGGVFYNLAHGESTMRPDPRPVDIADARERAGRWRLDDHGFELIAHDHPLADLETSEAARTAYLADLADLVRARMGTDCVHMLQVAVRTVDGERTGGREPVRFAHCDHPEESWRVYAAMAMGEAEATRRLANGRWMVLNLWRGLRPVESWPLALCDGSSVSADDFDITETWDKPGGTMSPFKGRPLRYSPAHRWHYFPDMQPDEMILFKQYDTADLPARWAPHSAVFDPATPPDAAPRASIEARALVCFG
jgi:hypothetical protein